MAHWRSVPIEIREAKLLADLAGVERDLTAVQDYCQRFLVERAKSPCDWVVVEALCAAALVRYGRTLQSAVREGVPKSLIDSLPPDLQEVHEFCKAARDKWIAHSVNTFEENQVSAWLMPPERGPFGVTSVTVRSHRVVALDSGAIDELNRLAETLERSIQRLAAEENVRLLARVQAMPPEPFYSQEVRTPLPGNDHPNTVRSGR